jgi:hypothetical protein
MGTLARRYAHVPLGMACLCLIVVTIAWLLERRVDGGWLPAAVGAAAPPAPVVLAHAPPDPASMASGDAGPDGARDADIAPAPPRVLSGASEPVPLRRYALESGPLRSAEVADTREEQLNRFGYSTIRFRKHDQARSYRVAAGFASADDARRVAGELGGGAVVEGDDTAHLVLHRLSSLREAIDAARALRARGVEPRVSEEVSPTVTYHIRYGQFTNEAAARHRREELARLGLPSQVVRVR